MTDVMINAVSLALIDSWFKVKMFDTVPQICGALVSFGDHIVVFIFDFQICRSLRWRANQTTFYVLSLLKKQKTLG